jgi:hypothetical protein
MNNTTCSKCGAQIDVTENFCPKCGQNINPKYEEITNKETISSTKKSKKKKYIILSIILVIVSSVILIKSVIIPQLEQKQREDEKVRLEKEDQNLYNEQPEKWLMVHKEKLNIDDMWDCTWVNDELYIKYPASLPDGPKTNYMISGMNQMKIVEYINVIKRLNINKGKGVKLEGIAYHVDSYGHETPFVLVNAYFSAITMSKIGDGLMWQSVPNIADRFYVSH